jgi:hypothetical protein
MVSILKYRGEKFYLPLVPNPSSVIYPLVEGSLELDPMAWVDYVHYDEGVGVSPRQNRFYTGDGE